MFLLFQVILWCEKKVKIIAISIFVFYAWVVQKQIICLPEYNIGSPITVVVKDWEPENKTLLLIEDPNFNPVDYFYIDPFSLRTTKY